MIFDLIFLAVAIEIERSLTHLANTIARWSLFVFAWLELTALIGGIGYQIAQGNTTGCAMMFNVLLMVFALNIENLQKPNSHENSTI
jgi:hypothetical protein